MKPYICACCNERESGVSAGVRKERKRCAAAIEDLCVDAADNESEEGVLWLKKGIDKIRNPKKEGPALSEYHPIPPVTFDELVSSCDPAAFTDTPPKEEADHA